MPKKATTCAVPSTHAIYELSPGCFLVREHQVHSGKLVVKDCVLFSRLDGARRWCADLGLTNQGRLAEDDPTVVEVWT